MSSVCLTSNIVNLRGSLRTGAVINECIGGGVDISTWQISFIVYPLNQGPGVPMLTKTVGSGITIVNGPQGQLQIVVQSSDLAGWFAPQTYGYVLSRSDVPTDLVSGFFTVYA